MPKIKVNLPVFIYNNSHLSLKLLYLLISLMYIFKCTVVNLYMCIYVHIDTEGLMED